MAICPNTEELIFPVRQLQYELKASNLEVTIKSNLDSKLTQHIKLNNEARRVTRGFRNKISLTVTDVLVQTNFSLKALEGFQEKRNALEERHEASKLQMSIMKCKSIDLSILHSIATDLKGVE